jgi:hypothetical protein
VARTAGTLSAKVKYFRRVFDGQHVYHPLEGAPAR